MEATEFLEMLQHFILKRLAAVKLSKAEKNRLFNELRLISEKLDDLVDSYSQKLPENFERIIDQIINEFEGGYADSKSDPGGTTMYGISSRFYPHLTEKIKTRTLTLEEAKRIYYEDYFLKIYRVHSLHPTIAFIILDSKIHGSYESIVDMQEWLNFTFDELPPIEEDGIYYRQTFERLSLVEDKQIGSLMSYLDSEISGSSRSAADRVIGYQKANNLPVTDYKAGFTRRLALRYKRAQEITV